MYTKGGLKSERHGGFFHCPKVGAENYPELLKFMCSKKATKIDEIFTVDLIVWSKCLIDGEDFINFCGLLRKYKLYNLYMAMIKY